MNESDIRERVKTTVFLPGDLHLRLKLEAVQQRTSMADLLVAALEQYFAEANGTPGEAVTSTPVGGSSSATRREIA